MIYEKYHRLPDHNLDFYIPKGDLISSFILISPNKATVAIPNARVITIKQEYRAIDQKWLLSFQLNNPCYDRIFNNYCLELFEKTRSLQQAVDGPDCVLLEFLEWKNLFSTDTLDKKDIQGLIGELLFLRDYLIPRYGEEKAIESWARMNNGKQDFILDDTWYEIKTLKTGSEKITISSIEQLDNPKDGHLVIISLNPSTIVSMNSVTVNTLYCSISEEIVDPHTKRLFMDILKPYGLPNDLLDSIVFEEMGIDSYSVNESFPRIRKDDYSEAISIPSYEIMIPVINNFREVL